MRINKSILCILTPLATGLCLPVCAQEDGLFELSLEQLLDTKVDSTSFTSEHFSETNYNVTPTHSTNWSSSGVRNLGELMNQMPSTIAPMRFAQARMMAVRGYMDEDSNTGIAVRLDGVPLNKIRSGSGIMALDGYDLNLLNSVELIRGPGSSLHGNDAFSGVLNLSTLKFQSEPQTLVAVEAGELNYRALSVSNSISVGSHQLVTGVAHRYIGDVEQQYDYLDRSTGTLNGSERSNNRESNNALIKYRYHSGDWSLDSSVYLFHFDINEAPGVGFINSNNSQYQDDSDYREDMQLFRVGGQYRINDHRSVNVMAYHWRDQDTLDMNLRLHPLIQSYLFETRDEAHSGLRIYQTNQLSDKSNFTFGYEYLAAEQTSADMLISPVSGDEIYTEQPSVGYQRELHSLFVDGHQQLNRNGLLLKYGLRLDSYNDFDNQLMPRLGFTQPLPHGQTLHLTYGEGFRAPAMFESLGNTYTAPNTNLQPERLQSLDLKYTLAGKHIYHAVTLFSNSWKDAIETHPLDEPQGSYSAQFSNAGESRAHGLEYELKGQWEKLYLEFSFSRIHDKDKMAEKDYVAFPQWISDLKAGYEFTPNWSLFCTNRYMYRSAFDEALTPSDAIRYFRTDTVLTWSNRKSLQINLVIRNLLDRDLYIPVAIRQPDGLEDEHRNISTSIKYSF